MSGTYTTERLHQCYIRAPVMLDRLGKMLDILQINVAKWCIHTQRKMLLSGIFVPLANKSIPIFCDKKSGDWCYILQKDGYTRTIFVPGSDAGIRWLKKIGRSKKQLMGDVFNARTCQFFPSKFICHFNHMMSSLKWRAICRINASGMEL